MDKINIIAIFTVFFRKPTRLLSFLLYDVFVRLVKRHRKKKMEVRII